LEIFGIKNMNYKLAKQLKEAGFPQEYINLPSKMPGYTQVHSMDVVWEDGLVQRIQFKNGYWEARDGDKWTHIELENSNACKIPTLSELIEVCGDRMVMLFKEYKERKIIWVATDGTVSGDWILDASEYKKARGKTPEEAVANLWLELNKK